MKTYVFTFVAENTPSKHLKKMNGRLLPIKTAVRLYASSERLRDRRAKSIVKSLNVREWTDINYGLPEA